MAAAALAALSIRERLSAQIPFDAVPRAFATEIVALQPRPVAGVVRGVGYDGRGARPRPPAARAGAPPASLS